MPPIGKRDQKFSTAFILKRKSMGETFFYHIVLQKKVSFALQKLYTYGKMAGIFLGNCGLPALPSIVSLSPGSIPHDTAQLVISQTQPPSLVKGCTSTAPWELQLTRGSSKIPTEHCSSVSNYRYGSWTARCHWESSVFP